MRGLFLGVVVLGACYGQIVPLYEAQSDLTSGTLVAAGSIGVVALAGRAGPLWLEIHWQIQKNYLKKRKINLMCYSNCRVGDIVCPQEFKKGYYETTTQTPEKFCADLCEDLVSAEKAKHEEEKEGTWSSYEEAMKTGKIMNLFWKELWCF